MKENSSYWTGAKLNKAKSLIYKSLLWKKIVALIRKMVALILKCKHELTYKKSFRFKLSPFFLVIFVPLCNSCTLVDNHMTNDRRAQMCDTELWEDLYKLVYKCEIVVVISQLWQEPIDDVYSRLTSWILSWKCLKINSENHKKERIWK